MSYEYNIGNSKSNARSFHSTVSTISPHSNQFNSTNQKSTNNNASGVSNSNSNVNRAKSANSVSNSQSIESHNKKQHTNSVTCQQHHSGSVNQGKIHSNVNNSSKCVQQNSWKYNSSHNSNINSGNKNCSTSAVAGSPCPSATNSQTHHTFDRDRDSKESHNNYSQNLGVSGSCNISTNHQHHKSTNIASYNTNCVNPTTIQSSGSPHVGNQNHPNHNQNTTCPPSQQQHSNYHNQHNLATQNQNKANYYHSAYRHQSYHNNSRTDRSERDQNRENQHKVHAIIVNSNQIGQNQQQIHSANINSPTGNGGGQIQGANLSHPNVTSAASAPQPGQGQAANNIPVNHRGRLQQPQPPQGHNIHQVHQHPLHLAQAQGVPHHIQGVPPHPITLTQGVVGPTTLSPTLGPSGVAPPSGVTPQTAPQQTPPVTGVPVAPPNTNSTSSIHPSSVSVTHAVAAQQVQGGAYFTPPGSQVTHPHPHPPSANSPHHPGNQQQLRGVPQYPAYNPLRAPHVVNVEMKGTGMYMGPAGHNTGSPMTGPPAPPQIQNPMPHGHPPPNNTVPGYPPYYTVQQIPQRQQAPRQQGPGHIQQQIRVAAGSMPMAQRMFFSNPTGAYGGYQNQIYFVQQPMGPATPQYMSMQSHHGTASANSGMLPPATESAPPQQQPKQRERKRIEIVDPVTKKPIEVQRVERKPQPPAAPTVGPPPHGPAVLTSPPPILHAHAPPGAPQGPPHVPMPAEAVMTPPMIPGQPMMVAHQHGGPIVPSMVPPAVMTAPAEMFSDHVPQPAMTPQGVQEPPHAAAINTAVPPPVLSKATAPLQQATTTPPAPQHLPQQTNTGGSASAENDAFTDETPAVEKAAVVAERQSSPAKSCIPNAEEKDVDNLEEQRKVEAKNVENLRKTQEAVKDVSQTADEVTERERESVSADKESTVDSKASNDGNESVEEGEITSDMDEDFAKEEEDDDGKPKLKYEYKEGQWSPVNPEGKKQYDRSFLLRLQDDANAIPLPERITNLDIFTTHRHTLGTQVVRDGAHTFVQPRNGPPMPGNRMPGNRDRARGQSGRSDNKVPKKVITLSSSLNQDVKLHVAENAWKATPGVSKEVSDADEALYKTFRGILNKLTPQRFEALQMQIESLQINTEARLSHIAGLVLEKALNETHFASTYAELCKKLLKHFEVSKSDSSGKSVEHINFRKMLLSKCQQEFEKDTDTDEEKEKREKQLADERQAQIDAAKSEEEVKHLKDLFTEQDAKAKRRTLGLMRFIGELYNLSILNADIMRDCFKRLMTDKTDEDSIVCVCKLFTTVGKKLAEDAQTKTVYNKNYQGLMSDLSEIIIQNKKLMKQGSKKALSQRVIFMLEDVKELRDRNWIPRRDEKGPMTLDQIHKDAEREKLLANAPAPSPGGQRNYGGSIGGSERRERDGNRGRPFGSHSQSNVRAPDFKGQRMDGLQAISSLSSLKSLTAMGGSAGAQWRTGATGGGSRNSSQRGANNSLVPNKDSDNVEVKNKFHLLGQDGEPANMPSRENSQSRASRDDSRKMLNHGHGMLSRDRRDYDGDHMDRDRERMDRDRSSADSRGSSRSGSLVGPSMNQGHGPDLSHSTGTQLKGDDNINEEKIRISAGCAISEFLCNSNMDETIRYICQTAGSGTLVKYLSFMIEEILESKKPHVTEKTGDIFVELHNKHVASQSNIIEALKSNLSYANDLVIDIPKYFDYMAEFVAQIAIKASPDFLKCLLKECSSVLKTQDVPCSAKFLFALFTRINQVRKNGAAELWRSSGLDLNQLVAPAEDIKSLRELVDVSQNCSPGIGLSPQALSDRFRTALEQPSEKVLDAVNDVMHQAGETNKEEAVKTLFCVLFRKCLVDAKDNKHSKESKVVFKPDPVKADLEQFLKNTCAPINLQLQALYALQLVMEEIMYQKEPMMSILNFLYDKDIVCDSGYFAWEKDNPKHEQRGYSVTKKNAHHFLEWLRSDDNPPSESTGE